MNQTKINQWAANQPDWALKNLIRALDTPLGTWLNTVDDNTRVAAAKLELQKRKVAA